VVAAADGIYVLGGFNGDDLAVVEQATPGE